MFFSDNDYEVIEYKMSAQGIPTHIAIKRPDNEPSILNEGLAEQFRMADLNPGIRVTDTPSFTQYRDGYYDNEGADRSLSRAWDRFENEFGGDEAREVFARYVNVFRPGVAVYSVNLVNGCSQGDWVHLILWFDEATIDEKWTKYTRRHDRPLNIRRAQAIGQAFDCLKAYCDEHEAAATGEAYIVAVHELDAVIDLDTPDIVGTVHEIQFELGSVAEDCGGVIGDEHADEYGKEMLRTL